MYLFCWSNLVSNFHDYRLSTIACHNVTNSTNIKRIKLCQGVAGMVGELVPSNTSNSFLLEIKSKAKNWAFKYYYIFCRTCINDFTVTTISPAATFSIYTWQNTYAHIHTWGKQKGKNLFQERLAQTLKMLQPSVDNLRATQLHILLLLLLLLRDILLFS